MAKISLIFYLYTQICNKEVTLVASGPSCRSAHSAVSISNPIFHSSQSGAISFHTTLLCLAGLVPEIGNTLDVLVRVESLQLESGKLLCKCTRTVTWYLLWEAENFLKMMCFPLRNKDPLGTDPAGCWLQRHLFGSLLLAVSLWGCSTRDKKAP